MEAPHASHAPMVADAFSTEVEQRIAGAPAGVEGEADRLAAGPLAAAPQATSPPQGVVSLSHEVRHEVSIPDNFPYVPLSQYVPPEKAAREYPFTLDEFQKLSIACIERNESVLVSAHTSAGKTVVAEYAIAKALANGQRVIYTSPIKALSNQKYRELNETFGDVGLMTGDVTINGTASCLVMTTEILRSMLYRGSEVMREVSWVVFDEIHYMRDKERGVVWEETLILLPDSVRYVFLSATIPNAMQFARWICAMHSQPCHVVYTNYRPTPLQHYLFPSGASGIYLAVDENRVFREDNFQKALSVFGESGEDGAGGASQAVLGEASQGARSRKRRPPPGKTGGQSDISKVIKMIMSKNLHPAIVFSFSKKDCEHLAMQVSKIDFNTDEERRLVSDVFKNALESLAEEDRQLPQIASILPLLKNGIGIHHSGLLPILKEVIEILFQEGLIKLLFATETFSIGLNMPARTVVFTNARKFDGHDFRWLSSGEYIQMSGRAGRRGLDARGIVILMIEEKMDPLVAKNMLKGEPDALNSAFHLSYNMILNLMRVEGVSPDFMLHRSFFQFQNADGIPALEEQLARLQAERDALTIEDEASIAEYWSIRQQLEACKRDHSKVVHHFSYSLPFLQAGRLVYLKDSRSGLDYGWCPVVNVVKKAPRSHGSKDAAACQEEGGGSGKGEKASGYVMDVLAYCERAPVGTVTVGIPKPFVKETSAGAEGEMIVLPVALTVVEGISAVRIYMPKDLRSADDRQTVHRAIKEVTKRFPDGLPLLDPVEDMGIKDEAFKALLGKISALEAVLFAHAMHKSPLLAALYGLYSEKKALEERIGALAKHIRETNAIAHMEELKSRKRLLRRMAYTTAEDVIEMKGRVACEISTGDELLLTELMFAGTFNDLTPEQTVALLSCFVFQEKSEDTAKLKEELAGPLRAMQDAARRIAKVSIECKLAVNEEEYVLQFRPELMDVVYAWCKGAKFAKVCKMTDVYEGSIIRCMRRLEELLRQMAQAAKSIGNVDLEAKFNSGITKLKRDIVFANSLYL